MALSLKPDTGLRTLGGAAHPWHMSHLQSQHSPALQAPVPLSPKRWPGCRHPLMLITIILLELLFFKKYTLP